MESLGASNKPHPLPAPHFTPIPAPPERLTTTRRVSVPDGVINKEREFVLTNRDSRIIKHLIEYGVATRAILAVLTGANSGDIDRVLDALRKRLSALEEAGLISIEGQGRSAIVRPTLLAYNYYPFSILDGAYLPKHSLTKALSVSSVAAKLSRMSATEHPLGATVGLPILSSSRLMADFAVSFGGERWSEQNIAAHQQNASRMLAQQESYPALEHAATFKTLYNIESSDAATATLHRHLSIGGRNFLPGAIWQTTANNKDKRVADFVLPLPKMDGAVSAIAGLVEVEGTMSDEILTAKMRALTTHCVPFSQILVFIPSTQEASFVQVEKVWKRLLDFNINQTKKYSTDDLIILPYEPVSMTGVQPRYAAFDAIRPIKTFAKG